MEEQKNNQKVENLNKALESVIPAQPAKVEKKRVTKPRKKAVVKQQIITTKSRRKVAIARARLTKGDGSIMINHLLVEHVKPVELQEIILEPVKFSKATKEIANASTIKINVSGGGVSSQAYAARGAIAKAIVKAANNDSIKDAFMKYDRMLLVDDVRQVEPKKFLGTKARARFQKSYR